VSHLRQACGFTDDIVRGRWFPGRVATSGLEVHHTGGDAIARKLLQRFYSGFESLTPKAQQALIDTMPGYLINTANRAGAGPTHQALTNAMNDIGRAMDAAREAGTEMPVAEVFDGLDDAYHIWDPVEGPKIVAVAKAWFDTVGVRP